MSHFIGRTTAAVAIGTAVCSAGCVAPTKSDALLAADQSTVDAVQAKFDSDSTLYSRHITVRADNGVVTLGGYVWSTQEIQQARQDAQRAQGVTKVVNRIQVDRGAIQNAPSAY